MTLAEFILGAVTAQRAGELVLSHYNTRRLMARGAVEVAPRHYPVMVAVHATWLISLWVFGHEAPIDTPALMFYLVLQGLRFWVMRTLGPRWTTRIIVLPGEPLVKAGAAIVFNKVSFRYPGGLQVFDKFGLRLNAGQRVGLVGQSGGGKSTVFVLLQRFHDVNQGHISIDGQSISRVTQESLRKAISVVPQDISLFHRSIMENIRYGRPTSTDDEVLRAAIAARCDFVETLPQGLATMVGDRGVKFSGGQRQRIAIARAFLKDAPILLLDEATAALDSESEEAIREALARLMRGRTVIAIAHRLATLRNFDRVIMLQAGRIIEDGPPDRLMQGQGPYRELVAREMSRLATHAA